MGSPCSRSRGHSFRGHPWSRGSCSGRQQPFPFFAMDVDSPSTEEDRALAELLSNPLGFISALASAASTNDTQETSRKRKEAKDKVPEKKARFEVKLNVEGYKPEEMNIKLVDNSLIISGNHEHTDESGTVTRNFTRTWNIPENVELEELACNFNAKDNTMNVSAPWRAPLPPPVTEKVIPINVLDKVAPTDDKDKETSPPRSGDDATEKVATPSDPSVGA